MMGGSRKNSLSYIVSWPKVGIEMDWIYNASQICFVECGRRACSINALRPAQYIEECTRCQGWAPQKTIAYFQHVITCSKKVSLLCPTLRVWGLSYLSQAPVKTWGGLRHMDTLSLDIGMAWIQHQASLKLWLEKCKELWAQVGLQQFNQWLVSTCPNFPIAGWPWRSRKPQLMTWLRTCSERCLKERPLDKIIYFENLFY